MRIVIIVAEMPWTGLVSALLRAFVSSRCLRLPPAPTTPTVRKDELYGSEWKNGDVVTRPPAKQYK